MPRQQPIWHQRREPLGSPAMDPSKMEVILLADAPDALIEVCGVTLLERLLRILQRLGFRRAIVLSATLKKISAELKKPSWARADLIVELLPRHAGALTENLTRGQVGSLILPAEIYCDARLLATLCQRNSSAALVDSNPPEVPRSLVEGFIQTTRGRFCGPAMLTNDFASALRSDAPFYEQLRSWIDNNQIDIVDAATQTNYVVSMRRDLRPLCFPAPSPSHLRLAEKLVLDTAQKGTLDLPAYVHAPIETWTISRLCRTRITPNQITIAGLILGCIATAAFVMGYVGLGLLAALVFGIVDGLDGKQSRVKIETTERGEWEHELDYLIENSWWAAIALHLWSTGQLPQAFYFLALLIGSHLLDGLLRRRTKTLTGRLIDDLTPFDRAFRLIGGRRNIYVWTLACGFLVGGLAQAYVGICLWAAATTAVHLVRFIAICLHSNRPKTPVDQNSSVRAD